MSAVQVIGAGAPSPPAVRVRGCTFVAGHAQIGLLVLDGGRVVVEDNTITCPRLTAPNWTVDDVIHDPVVLGRAARSLLDGFIFGEHDDVTANNLLVGNPDILVPWVTNPRPDGRRWFVMHLPHWGNEFVTFASELALDADGWRQVFELNPLPGFPDDRTASATWIHANLRRLRSRIARHPFTVRGDQIPLPRGMIIALRAFADRLRATNASTAGSQGIVLAGDGVQISDALANPALDYFLTDPNPRPDAHVTRNHVDGFAQGIHVGTSVRRTRQPRVSYRVAVTDNTVHLRVPGLARSPHGIFVDHGYHTRVHGNLVERRSPGPLEWTGTAPIDAIRVGGYFGPSLHVRDNLCVGTTNGVVATAAVPTAAQQDGWTWTVAGNAHEGSGGGKAEQVNWPP